MFEKLKERREKRRVEAGADHIVRRIRDDGVSLPRNFDSGIPASDDDHDIVVASRVGALVEESLGNRGRNSVKFLMGKTVAANLSRNEQDDHISVVIDEAA